MQPELRIFSVGYEGGGPVLWARRGDEPIQAIRLTNAEAFDLLTNLARAIRFPEAVSSSVTAVGAAAERIIAGGLLDEIYEHAYRCGQRGGPPSKDRDVMDDAVAVAKLALESPEREGTA